MKIANATLLLVLTDLARSNAFLHRPSLKKTCLAPFNKSVCFGNLNDDNDPTKVWYAEIADGIQNFLTNSPLNEAKLALVRSLAGEYDVDATKTKLNNLISGTDSNNKVCMFSFTTWPFCIKAKAILDDRSIGYTVVELNEVDDGKALRAEMANLLGRTSVPAIFIDGTFIGGCNDGPMGGIVKLAESGKLDEMLK